MTIQWKSLALKVKPLALNPTPALVIKSLTLKVTSSVNSNAVSKMHPCDSSLHCLSIFCHRITGIPVSINLIINSNIQYCWFRLFTFVLATCLSRCYLGLEG